MNDENKDAYRRTARCYDPCFGRMNAGLRGIGLRMFPPYDEMAVLDVGCGTGMQLLAYQQSGCRAFGIDVSASMLEIARRRLGDAAHLDLGDAAHMPYADASFDLVTATTVLHEMAPEVRVAVLLEMKRVLRPEGRILLIDFEATRPRTPRGWLTRGVVSVAEVAAGRTHHRNYRHFLAHGGVPRLLDDCGYVVDRCRTVSGGLIGLYLALPAEREDPSTLTADPRLALSQALQ